MSLVADLLIAALFLVILATLTGAFQGRRKRLQGRKH